MLRHTCDICGKDIKPYLMIHHTIKFGYYGETQDVCSDCLSKVKKFIEDLKCQEQ